MKYYIEVLKKYAVFTGRARRSEYWYFTLFNTLISYGITILMSVTGASILGIVSLIYTFGVLIPSIAVAIRRMHDVGKSGWFCLIPFYNLYLAIQDSEPGSNQYGPNPKNNNALDVQDHLIT